MKQADLKNIRALILDMDGVLWRDSEPIGNLQNIFERLNRLGIQYVFATNNCMIPAAAHVDRLARFGVTVKADQIINSAMATGFMLHQRFPEGGPVYIVGEAGIRFHLSEFGFYEDDTDPLAVIVGLDRQITYDKIKKAEMLVRQGKPFYGTNPDVTYPIPEGLAPGAGTIIAAVATAAETAPIFGGKPEPAMFQQALEKMGLSVSECMAVGDRIDTDLYGGQRSGVYTAMVLTGVSTREQIAALPLQPDLVTESLSCLVDLLEEAHR